VKEYTFTRENEDFELIANKTTEPSSLDGLKMTFDSRFFTFDGVWLGVEWVLLPDIQQIIEKFK